MYNQDFIDKYNLEYLYKNNKIDKNYIDFRLKERARQFNENIDNIDENLISECIALDNLIAKKIIEDYQNKSSYNKKIIYTYINSYIKEEFNKNNYSFYSNPVMKLGPKYLSKYISKDSVKKLNDINIDMIKTIKKIYVKIESEEKITTKELDIICNYFYNKLPSTENDLKMANEVLNYVLKNPRNITLIQKYFILKTALIQKINSFNKQKKFNNYKDLEIELVIGDTSINEGGYSNEGKIFINRTHLRKCTFENNTYNPLNNWVDRHKEGLEVLGDLFHEFRHEEQKYYLRNNIIDDKSYYQVIRKIFLDYYNDSSEYDRNYTSYEIETDANHYKNVYLRDFIQNKELPFDKKVIENHIHIRNLNKIYEYSISGKKESNNAKFNITYKYNTNNIRNIIKQKPELLKKYPILLDYYKEDGTYKTMDEIILNPKTDFYYDNMLSFIENDELNRFDITKYPRETKTKILSALESIARHNVDKINKLYNNCKLKENIYNEDINKKQIFAQLSNTLKLQKKINNYITNIIIKYGKYMGEATKFWISEGYSMNHHMKKSIEYTMKFKEFYPDIYERIDPSTLEYNDYSKMFEDTNNNKHTM